MKGELDVNNIDDQRKYFSQLASGISFLHENGIQHCNITPENILCKETSTGLSLVISNFKWSRVGMNRNTSKKVKSKFDRRTIRTINRLLPCGYHMFVDSQEDRWSAPEQHRCLEHLRSDTEDVFSLGCVFHYIWTGYHPFEEISNAVRCGDITLCNVSLAALDECFVKEQHMASMAKYLVFKMICPVPSNRIKAREIMKQPFLWTNEEMMNFFRRVGSLMQDKDDSAVISLKKELEKGASKIFDGNWMDKLGPAVQSDLKGFKDAKREVCGLLRAIRNKIEHFEKIRNPELRHTYLDSPNGVIEYYTKRFPELVPYTHRILGESSLVLKN
jgi:serine/threonine protein kinase